MTAVPTKPRALMLSLTEEEPPIIQATWQAPRYTYGEVRGYRLIYGIQGDPRTEERRFEGQVYRHTTGFLGKSGPEGVCVCVVWVCVCVCACLSILMCTST